MSDALTTYLHDHLAASHFAVNLLETLRDRYTGAELGEFASVVLAEVKQDQETLQKIIEQVGSGNFTLMEATGWLAEKASKLKLRLDDPGGLGTFESLETLSLGIQGKLSLWRVLAVVFLIDPRVHGADFDQLAQRAQGQYNRMEAHRLECARTAFKVVAQEPTPEPKK
jgi:hypothetical protein